MIIFKKLNIRHKTIFIKNVLKNNKTFFMKKKKWQTIIIKMKSSPQLGVPVPMLSDLIPFLNTISYGA